MSSQAYHFTFSEEVVINLEEKVVPVIKTVSEIVLFLDDYRDMLYENTIVLPK